MANPSMIGVIIFENNPLSAIPTTGAFGLLKNSYRYYTNYHGTSSPSLPDYCAISSGSWMGTNGGNDKFGSSYSGPLSGLPDPPLHHSNIFAGLTAKNVSWKTYEQLVLQTDNYTTWHGSSYATRHCPAAFYSGSQGVPADARNTNGRFDFHTPNGNGFIDDIANGNLPQFWMCTPDIFNDGHTPNSAANANAWLSGSNPEGNSPPFLGLTDLIAHLPAGALVCVTFDNAPGASQPIFFGVCGPGVTSQTITTQYNHFSFLLGVQQIFGVNKFTDGDEAAGYVSGTPLPLPAGGGGGGGDTTPPSVPTGLATTSVQSNSVALSWTASTDNVGVTGYKVFRNGGQVGSPAGTSFTDSTVAAGTTYNAPGFAVSAQDAAGNTSAQSAGLVVTTPPVTDGQAPTVPTGLAASNITTSSATISWTRSTDNVGVTGYTVYRGSMPIIDSFARTAAASLGSTDTGQAWVIDQGSTSQFSVDGAQAAITGIAGNAPISHVATTQEATPVVQFKYRFSSAATGAIQSIAAAARLTDAQNYDRMVITQTISGNTNVEMDMQVANANTTIAGPTTITAQVANTWYWARFEIAPSGTWNGYVWPDGTAQPSTPTITGTNTADTNTTGFTGLRLQCLASNTNLATYNIDQFSAGAYGSSQQTVASPSYTDPALTPSSSYSYTVDAFDAAGNHSSRSGAVQVTTPQIVSNPNQVNFSSLTDAASGTTSVTLAAANATAGGTMFAHVTTIGSSALTPPAGWTLLGSAADGTAITTSLYSKTVDATPYTWTSSGATSISVTVSSAPGTITARVSATANSGGTAKVATTGAALTGVQVNDEVCTFISSAAGPRPYGDSGCLFGLMPLPSDWSTQSAIAAVETTVNRKLAAAHSMVPWDHHVGATHGDLTASGLAPTVDYNNNRLTYISWPRPRPGADGSESSWQSTFGTTDPNTIFQNMAGGTYDSIIDANAAAYKAQGQATGAVFIVRWCWEMNGGGVIFDIGQSSSQAAYVANFIAAFQRWVTRTRAVAKNVYSHWNPQNFQTTAVSRDQLYPGDASVDFGGTEGYLSPGDTFSSLMTDTSSNGHTYNAIYSGYGPGSSHGLFLGCGESGCRLQASGDTDTAVAGRVASYASDIPTFPGWKFLVWWNANGANGDSTIANQGPLTLAQIKSLIASNEFTPALNRTWKAVS